MLMIGALLALLLSAAPIRVSRGEILDAMRESQGYDLTATANGARLNAEVVMRIARAARDRDPEGPPLLLGREEWFSAFLERTGLTPAAAPLYARLAYQHKQDTQVEYRFDRVVRRVEEGPRPQLAANVRIWWPDSPGAPGSYSYEDALASPRLRVTNKRVISYRLLDYGDMVFYGDVEGLQGRPVSGVLGALFDLIGEVAVVESRMTIAPDGIQVSRGRGRKAFIDVTRTVTVFPDGRADRGLPPNRPDLVALEARLKRPVRVSFVPLP